jgi:hypothetical protein
VSSVTTTVPAEPVNLEMNSRRLKQSGAYSDMCGSSVGTMYACTPRPLSAAFISSRSLLTFSSAAAAAAGACAATVAIARAATLLVLQPEAGASLLLAHWGPGNCGSRGSALLVDLWSL